MSLPDKWRRVCLKDVCIKIVGGGTPSTKNKAFWSGNINWISSADIHGLKDIRVRSHITPEAVQGSTTNLVAANTIIVVTRVGLGKIAITDSELCFNQDCQGLILDENKIILPYALYVLSQAVKMFRYSGRGTTISGVTKKQLENVEINLPPLDEQERIVAKIEEFFSEIDSSINGFMTTKSHLLMYKASVLDKAFKRVAEEFPGCVKGIGEAYKVYVGATPARKETSYWNGDINWVSSGEVAFSDIRNTKEKITPIGLAKTSTRLHPPGTVMLAMIGEGKTRGQTGILKIHAAHNQNTAAIEIDNDRNVSEYLYYYLMSEYDRTRNIGSGNNQKALNKSRVEAMKIPLPSKQTQQDVVSRISVTLSHIENLSITVNDSLEHSHTLRQTILLKAFKGELV